MKEFLKIKCALKGIIVILLSVPCIKTYWICTMSLLLGCNNGIQIPCCGLVSNAPMQVGSAL